MSGKTEPPESGVPPALPSPGQTASFTRTLTEADVFAYAKLIGDNNPLHLDREAAAAGMFGERIVHGMLVTGLLSTVLATKLPGPGTIYLGQQVRFRSPVFLGDTVTAWVEVLEVMEEKRRVRLRTWCANQDGKTVLDGEALVMCGPGR